MIAVQTPADSADGLLCVACKELPTEATTAPYCPRCADELEAFYAEQDERERGDQVLDRMVAVEGRFD